MAKGHTHNLNVKEIQTRIENLKVQHGQLEAQCNATFGAIKALEALLMKKEAPKKEK